MNTSEAARLPPHGWRALLGSRELSVVLVIVLLCVFLAATSARDTFFTQRNATNILRQAALLGVFAIGETVVIICGGIDLSLGSLIAFSGMAMAMLGTRLAVPLVPGAAAVLAVVVALAVSGAIGGVHATLIHRLRLPPFVVTLGSLLILRSQAALMNDQLPVPIQDFPGILYLAQGSLWEGSRFAVPIPVLLVGAVACTTAVLLTRFRVGRYVYSIGCNETATRLSGVNVYRAKLFAYGVSGLLGGLAGILWAANGGQGDPQSGVAYELDAVAASVLGGASLMGGQGSVWGTVLGACLLHVIFSAINLTLTKPDLWRGTVVGGVLLFAVLVSALQQRRSA